MACVSCQGLVRSLERRQKMVQSPLEKVGGSGAPRVVVLRQADGVILP